MILPPHVPKAGECRTPTKSDVRVRTFLRQRTIATAAALLSLGLFATAALAQTPRVVVADMNGSAGPHTSMPLMTVGAGRANEGLRADWQEQLATVQREIGFGYIRFHGLLSDDMGVYFEGRDGQPIYNFQYVDALYDRLLQLHIRPIVELSFMPRQLAGGDKTVFWWKGNITPPKDMTRWNGLILALVEHWIARYGREEVEKWYFEVWNEPDLSIFWSGTQQDYLDLYRNTAEVVKKVCGACKVGGPASAYFRWEQPWLNFVTQNHIPADFLSTHSYAVQTGAVDVDGTALTRSDIRPEAITGRVKRSREWIQATAPQLELHYTEWSTSYTPTDYIHDQYISAPFILQKLRESTGLADSMSYWTFTDIFEENGPRYTPFHGGFGLMNYQGIRKPAYFAYKFLNRLGTVDLACTDRQSWITRTSGGSLHAILWDYTPPETPPGDNNQHFCRQEQPSQPSPGINFKVTGLKPGPYSLRLVRVGYQANDAFTAWLRLGAPQQLSREQVATLQRAASGSPEIARTVQVRPDGSFHLHVNLRRNDAVLLTLDR